MPKVSPEEIATAEILTPPQVEEPDTSDLELIHIQSEAPAIESKTHNPLAQKLREVLGKISLEGSVAVALDGPMLMARGGNFKVTRMNLQNSGKANAKQPMPMEQKRARKRKRKKK